MNHRKALWPQHLVTWSKFELQPHKKKKGTEPMYTNKKKKSTVGRMKKEKEIWQPAIGQCGILVSTCYHMQWIFVPLKSYRPAHILSQKTTTRGSKSLSCPLLSRNQQNFDSQHTSKVVAALPFEYSFILLYLQK